MDKKKAEEEVSALITVVSLLGLIVPFLLVWATGRFQALSQRLVEIGVLEQSDRVVLEISNDVGLDTGRLLILIGIILLTGIFVIRIFRTGYLK